LSPKEKVTKTADIPRIAEKNRTIIELLKKARFIVVLSVRNSIKDFKRFDKSPATYCRKQL